MKIDKEIAGYPMKPVRNFLKWMALRQNGVLLEDAKVEAKAHGVAVSRLMSAGLVTKEKHLYHATDLGIRIARTLLIKRFNRATATRLIRELLDRAEQINADPKLAHFIKEIRLFGSVLNNSTADDYGDIDLALILERKTNWKEILKAEYGRRITWTVDDYIHDRKKVQSLLKNRDGRFSFTDPENLKDIFTNNVQLYPVCEIEL